MNKLPPVKVAGSGTVKGQGDREFLNPLFLLETTKEGASQIKQEKKMVEDRRTDQAASTSGHKMVVDRRLMTLSWLQKEDSLILARILALNNKY